VHCPTDTPRANGDDHAVSVAPAGIRVALDILLSAHPNQKTHMLNITDKADTVGSSRTMAAHAMKLNGNVYVTKTDIDCSNDVIHAANPVLVPE
jgi:quinolinate synthase